MSKDPHAIADALADTLHLGDDDERAALVSALRSGLLVRALAVLRPVMVDEALAIDAAAAWANERIRFLSAPFTAAEVESLIQSTGGGGEEFSPNA